MSLKSALGGLIALMALASMADVSLAQPAARRLVRNQRQAPLGTVTKTSYQAPPGEGSSPSDLTPAQVAPPRAQRVPTYGSCCRGAYSPGCTSAR
jgi:hypothetical protein